MSAGETGLDRALLDRLEAQWRADAVSWLDNLQPGRSADDVRAALAEIGLAAPQQLLDWWGWHDAATMAAYIGGGAQLVSLEASMRLYATHRELAEGLAAAEHSNPDLVWPSYEGDALAPWWWEEGIGPAPDRAVFS